MKPASLSSRLYQADLYDQIKIDGNHIICLNHEQTKTFILLAAIKNHAHQLHPKFGSSTTLVVEPSKSHADELQRIVSDHTELNVVNLFSSDVGQDDGQVIIKPISMVLSQATNPNLVNLVVLDHAHLLLLQDINLVKAIVARYKGVQILTFMCSLIHNNPELTPRKTVQLISYLENVLSASCETSSDLRSMSRQSPITNLDVIESKQTDPVVYDWCLLADSMLKQFCDLMLDKNFDESEPMIKPESSVARMNQNSKQPVLNTKKQLVLVRSCLSDVIYSVHCLGLWSTKKTVQLYLTEFSRLLQAETVSGHLIAAAATLLNCFYSRLDELTNYSGEEGTDLKMATQQLKSLLEYINEFKPIGGSVWPICIVHVRRRVLAKVIALWLDKISRNYSEYSFIKPNYTVGSTRKHRNRMAVDNFDLHHEASVRDFRFGNSNVLVTSAIVERCTDMPRCSLVVSFDIPARFSDFIQAKGNCRYDSSKYVVILNNLLEVNPKEKLLNYINMERLLNNVNKKHNLESDEASMVESLEKLYPAYPSKNSKTPATIWRSIGIINKYCTKLPSDSFTKLSPEWIIKQSETQANETTYHCEVRLPINSPVRQTIVGPQCKSKNIAMRLAALTACKVLHKAGELDDNMMPITKESLRNTSSINGTRFLLRSKIRCPIKGQSMGSTKHRQYYKKRIAKVFSGPVVSEGIDCHLYRFQMTLTCPIPDEQNRRGRRIIDPGETNRNYAIVCTSKLPKICSFPVFTRSGEVMISVELVKENISFDELQVKNLRIFHEFTFSRVLRLEKYPTVFEPDRSLFTVLLAPVIDNDHGTSNIDWKFVDKIVHSDTTSHVPSTEERRSFQFCLEDYIDAVVIPWYRLTDRQQFAYYVAEICTDLNPESSFPDEGSGFKTFIDYYRSKYNIDIFNKSQPVLDVDHTSARLNLLTPRYVNRKGRTLPSSTAKTRRESRESLVQKQLLIPELCSIHPFPASFWRKAVCLPCIFYRLNSLYLAEELRRTVAEETKVGFVEPPTAFHWPPLDFGWSLKDVINNQPSSDDPLEDQAKDQDVETIVPRVQKLAIKKERSKVPPKKVQVEMNLSSSSPSNSQDFVIDHFDPSQYVIPDIPLDAPPNDWMNIKLISSTGISNNDGPCGWDQPLVQQDLFLEHTNEATWSDCEMEFSGELTEQVGRMRCGSPSSFEPGTTKSHGINEVLKEGLVPELEMSRDKSESPKKSKAVEFAVNSDSSWSSTEEEEAAQSEEDIQCYGEWKDSKSKNRPLLRELFIPSVKSLAPCRDDVDSLYKMLDDHFKSELPKEQIEHLLSHSIDSIQAHVKLSDDPKKFVSLLNKVLEQDLQVSDELVSENLEYWFKTMNQLSARVEQTLLQDPELFKDNDIELVTVDDSFSQYNLEIQPTFGELLPNRDQDCSWPNEEWKNIKFDPSNVEIDSHGPGPSIILQALTMSNASDGINLERLETVGDSFLKYSITAYLYCMYPSMHEGKLSYLRSTEISNANLYQLGRSKNLGEIMSATKFEPNDNWLAPGYCIAGCASSGEVESNKRREIDKALAEVPYDLLLQHSIPDKSIADCVEALIGAYLTASGSRAALLFMQWLGLRVVPPTFDLQSSASQVSENQSNGVDTTIWRWLGTPPSPLICKAPSYEDESFNSSQQISEADLKAIASAELDRLYYANNLDKFERDIHYKFKDRAYLVQAFTHNSYYENHVTDCHQRLEFLGDALLDYLITRYLFEDPRCHSPGTLTDLRSALVNNTFFASLAVKYKFHKYLKYISDELFHVIDGFVKKFRFDSQDTITKGYTLLISEGESEYAEDIEVPKALGDVFESVAGAIYLDSGMSLDHVWRVYFKMMKPEIEYFSSNVPKSPIRELLESMPQNVRFSPSELAPDRKHRVIAEVFGLGRFTGVGRNKHSAKSTAAKRALRMLALRRKEVEELEKSRDDSDNSSIRHQ